MGVTLSTGQMEDVTHGQQFIKLCYRAILTAKFGPKEAVVLLLSYSFVRYGFNALYFGSNTSAAVRQNWINVWGTTIIPEIPHRHLVYLWKCAIA